MMMLFGGLILTKVQKPPYTSLAICVDDAVVGCIGIILGQDIHECQAEIGYWLGEEYWGKGIMSEALKQMTTYTFEHFPQIQRIFAGVFDTNKASQKVLKRAGINWNPFSQNLSSKKDDVMMDIYMLF
jgi:RimJ/RimL family protein N-acetyltransferase